MAWLSVGTSNEDLCDKMMDYGILEEGVILDAFRSTDKGDFVLEKDRLEAYQDRPFKKGNVHISAPHMYVTVLGGLELEPGISFLNVGSGSGYLSCLVSHIVGPSGLCHGIEINDEAVNHSRACTSKWMDKYIESLTAKENLEHKIDSYPENGDFTSSNSLVNKTNIQMIRDSITFTHGNCFHLNTSNIISHGKYDRIYVGAGCPVSHKDFFCHLLELNGILILPIHETSKMMKYKCIAEGVYTSEVICTVTFAPLVSTSNCTQYLNACDANYEVPFRSAEMDILSVVHSSVGSTTSVKNVVNIEGNAVSKVVVHKNIAEILTSGLVTALSPVSKKNTKKRSVGGSVPTSPTTTMSTAPLPNSVTLPPVLWSPNKYRHRQYPSTFRDAVFTILMCSRYVSSAAHCAPHCSGCSKGASTSIGSVLSSGITSGTASSTTSSENSSGKGSDVTDTSFSSMVVYSVSAGGDSRVFSKRRSVYGVLPSQIWIYIITFCNRDWFNPPVSAIQLLTQSLLLERKLRALSEEKLDTAVAARRAAERERDLYRNVMARMSRNARQAYLAEGEEDSEEEKEDFEEEEDVTVEDMDEEEQDEQEEEEEMDAVSEEDSDPEPDSDDDSVEEGAEPDSDDDTVDGALVQTTPQSQLLPPLPILAWTTSGSAATAHHSTTNTVLGLTSATATITTAAVGAGDMSSPSPPLLTYGDSSDNFAQYRNSTSSVTDQSCDTTVLSSHFTINDADDEHNNYENNTAQNTEHNTNSSINNINNTNNSNDSVNNSIVNDHMLCTSFDSHTTNDYSMSYLSTYMNEYSSNNYNSSNNDSMLISPIKPLHINNNRHNGYHHSGNGNSSNTNNNASSHHILNSKESRHRKYSNISELSFDESIADEAEDDEIEDELNNNNSTAGAGVNSNPFTTYASYKSYLHSMNNHDNTTSPAHKISKTCNDESVEDVSSGGFINNAVANGVNGVEQDEV